MPQNIKMQELNTAIHDSDAYIHNNNLLKEILSDEKRREMKEKRKEEENGLRTSYNKFGFLKPKFFSKGIILFRVLNRSRTCRKPSSTRGKPKGSRKLKKIKNN